ncbi:cation-translocating P-type ATPase [Lactococcus cremoris]|jgi:cation-transporting ATPase E|uniref:ATPase P n=4 Tax=Lactococcus lactis subsp. cremoris TaxID=1359 RepID=A0A1E7G220_LACLC|nr:cation-translocating P-type ATPase [Lactococcus cremoris]MCI1841558.1 cation-translocating P-type ATPase [Lactococcus lactis]ADJ59559.1 ATPase, P-type (transporting), HAD superfamily, subfamily IC [Lactococcus cremoris subsp. cremoris NZ9000]KEY62853.1 Cation transport ATPase [Lactococcus cremoris subsp. cremoris GE214]KKW74629.1 plasma-membrane proton-efflux P-type ATPase [Lactococcus cremoris]KZK07499.1 Cation-transporting ATPase E1-E2 family [Lactococcus cremoris]
MSLKGLTSLEVEERIRQGKINKNIDETDRPVWEIVKRNTFTFFNLIFAVIAILISLVQAWNQLIFLPIIVINTIVGIYQEIKAKRYLDQMTLLHAPQSTVIRNGKQEKIASDDLVEEDIIILKTGNQIVADARIVEGSIFVNESLLTGEADEIEKNVDDKLLSGSFVVSGEAKVILEKVGKDSYISKLTEQAKLVSHGEDSEMLRALNKLLKWVSFIILPIAVILFTQNYFVNHNTLQTSVVAMVAAVIGMIPEGLYLLTTIALTLSSVKLARNQVLLHNMKSIESLARVDVLCVDKTGTITEPRMSVEQVFVSPSSEMNEQKFMGVLSNYISANTDDNDTMKAIREFMLAKGDLQNQMTGVKKIIPFSSKVKYSAVCFENESYLLGAPEIVLGKNYEKISSEINHLLKEGFRVLVLARTEEKNYEQLNLGTQALGYVVLANPIRENARKTFNYFAQQGVNIKVISGDNPQTVSAVAKRAGIMGAEHFIDANLLKTEEDLDQAIESYTVFGRVTPDQKRRLVQALKRKGHTVAMTGDGVNDILAMKSADCSIAMASGSDAATQVAQVVLLDSDFGHMTQVVTEGRRVVNNVQRSAILFLVKNLFSIILAIISAIFVFTYPLQASQLSLISLFTIGIPGFLLSLEENDKRIEKDFIKNVILKALPASLTEITAVLGVVIAGAAFKLTASEISTSAVILLAVVGFMILTKISAPLNRFKMGIIIFNIVGIILSGFIFNSLFSISKISLDSFVLVALLSLFSESLFRNFDSLLKKYFK